MKRFSAFFLLLCMLPAFALSDPVPLGEAAAGTFYWPDDVAESEAVYTYTYAFPHAEGDSSAAEGINAFYTDFLEDAAAFTVPINGESIENPEIPAYTDVSCTVTCNNDDAFSVLVTTHTSMDGFEYEVYSANVFARSGAREGLVISLPYLLGILDGSETDSWLQDRQTAKADKCVRDIIWESVEANEEGREYLPDISYDFFQDMFYPEEDFYLDETGNPVFFVQPGILTPEEEGVLLFPISLEYLIDEI